MFEQIEAVPASPAGRKPAPSRHEREAELHVWVVVRLPGAEGGIDGGGHGHVHMF